MLKSRNKERNKVSESENTNLVSQVPVKHRLLVVLVIVMFGGLTTLVATLVVNRPPPTNQCDSQITIESTQSTVICGSDVNSINQ